MHCENCNRETDIRVTGDDPHCPGCRIACGSRMQTEHVEFSGRVIQVDHETAGVMWSNIRADVAAMVDGDEGLKKPSWWRRMFGAA